MTFPVADPLFWPDILSEILFIHSPFALPVHRFSRSRAAALAAIDHAAVLAEGAVPFSMVFALV